MWQTLKSILGQGRRGVWPFKPWMEDLLAGPGWEDFIQQVEEGLAGPDDDVVWVNAEDGTPLALRAYLPEGEPQGVVLVVHALTLNSKFYRRLGTALAEAGLAAFLLDIRGHGLSGGRPGDCPRRHLLKQDISVLHTTLQALFPGKPVAWIGHSVGAMLGWKMLAETRVRPAAFVSIGAGPVWAALRNTLRTRRVILRPTWRGWLADGLGPRARILRVLVPPGLETYPFVLDYTPRFLLAALPLRLHGPALDHGIPILTVIGEQDQGYDAEAVGDFVAGLQGDVTLQIYPEADHLNIVQAAGPAIIRWLGGVAAGGQGRSVSVLRDAVFPAAEPERRHGSAAS